MADKTGIEWTDATWNPVRGCSRVSEGCRNCYAEGVAHRFSGPGQAYAGLTSVVNGKPAWSGTIRSVEEHLLQPMAWKKPRRICVNSMSDLFHPGVTDAMLDRIFAVMALCPRHTFQVLTKRPERMLAYLGGAAYARVRLKVCEIVQEWLKTHELDTRWARRLDDWPVQIGFSPKGTSVRAGFKWPLPNVWLGVSVENQEAADKRLGTLAMLGRMGWRTMVSFEPLLGAVMALPVWLALGPETWAICGGESGPGARPMHPDWARGLRDQCVAAGVPFFFKQWGEWRGAERGDQDFLRPDGMGFRPDENVSRWPDTHEPDPQWSIRVGKKAAGHLLDGKEWHQFPEVAEK